MGLTRPGFLNDWHICVCSSPCCVLFQAFSTIYNSCRPNERVCFRSSCGQNLCILAAKVVDESHKGVGRRDDDVDEWLVENWLTSVRWVILINIADGNLAAQVNRLHRVGLFIDEFSVSRMYIYILCKKINLEHTLLHGEIEQIIIVAPCWYYVIYIES